MTDAWTIKDKDGHLSAEYTRSTKSQVEQLVVGTYYNPRALHTDRAFRALFYRDLKEKLGREGWEIVPVRIEAEKAQ